MSTDANIQSGDLRKQSRNVNHYTATFGGYAGSFQQNINFTIGSHDPMFFYTHFPLSQSNVNNKAK
jgi:hypothetical protein